MVSETPNLEATISRMKNELRVVVADGIVPASCSNFGELDQYIDQNSLGGFCDDAFSDAMRVHFGGADRDGDIPEAMNRFVNDAQTAIDEWIKAGGLIKAQERVNGVGVQWGRAASAEQATRAGEMSENHLGSVMYISTFESRSFSFQALGETEAAARSAMQAGLVAHSKSVGIDSTWWSTDDINVSPCPVGGCVRDGEILMRPTAQKAELTGVEAQLAELSNASQWTPAQQEMFDKWFSKSMIHDGVPTAVFIGFADTGNAFAAQAGAYGRGTYFTNAATAAEAKAVDAVAAARNSVPIVASAFLNIQRPYSWNVEANESEPSKRLMEELRFSSADVEQAVINRTASDLIRAELEAYGYDGIVVRSDNGIEYIAFSPSQILEVPRDHQLVIDALDTEAKKLARANGFETVQVADPLKSLPHIGRIVAQTATHFIQNVGRATAMIHDKANFSTAPELNKSIEIRYEGGSAIQHDAKDRTKAGPGTAR